MLELPIKPQLAELVEPPSLDAAGKWTFPRRPFAAQGWVYEPKYDGNRMIAVVDTRVTLFSRSGRVITGEYPLIAQSLASFPAGTILDGETIVLRDGKPSISALARRRYARPEELRKSLRYMVFDQIRREDGVEIWAAPYSTRRGILRNTLGTYSTDDIVQLSECYSDGRHVWETVVVPLGLEGLIAKPVNAPYKFGERGTWLKIKLNSRSEFEIVGYTAGEGSRERSFGAAVLATREPDGSLRYRGRSGTGMTLSDASRMLSLMQRFETTEVPFAAPQLRKIKGRIGPREVTWIKPGRILATIEYAEVSDDGVPRFPSLKGVRMAPEVEVR